MHFILMEHKIFYRPYKRVIISLLAVFILVYLLYTVRRSEIIARQNDHLVHRIDSLTSIVSDLEVRLFGLEKSNYVTKHRIPDQILFCGDTLDTADPFLREKIEREFYSLLSKQGQIHLYLKRSLRYLPMIEARLDRAGLPEDLKFLAIHESALLPTIRSRSNAVGLWQFMYSTGRLYGLKINSYVDERQDPVKSTEAAITLLKELHRKFDDWPLVMAAYNGGVNRILRNMRRQKTSDFLALSLPQETERYYFKILATKLILENPAEFGYTITNDDYFYTPEMSSIEFSIYTSQMSLEEIAGTAGLKLAYFKHLNPQFINSFLPQGTYTLYIPEIHYTTFTANAEVFGQLSFKSVRKHNLEELGE